MWYALVMMVDIIVFFYIFSICNNIADMWGGRRHCGQQGQQGGEEHLVKKREQLKKSGRVVRDVQTRTFRRRHSWCSLVPQYCRAGIGEEAKLKLFFSYIRWISIRPRAKLDGRRTFLSKIETFTKTPFILSRDHFMEKQLFKFYVKLFSDKKTSLYGKIEFEVDALEVCVLQCMALCFEI